MKLSVAIAAADAISDAFVVFRGIEESIRKAHVMGYDGVELALKTAEQVNRKVLDKCLDEFLLEISCISTGQVFASTGLMFTDADPDKRARLRQVFEKMIDLACDYGGRVNIGRVRGQIGRQNRQKAEVLFIDMARRLCDYAAKKEVVLLLEPVNRYETDFINNIEQGVELLSQVGMPNMKLMPDVFHMNIEDKTIGESLLKYINCIGYIHLADSNRLAPGQGHLNFDDIFEHLRKAEYKGWVSVEILPKPDPDTAALQAVKYLRPLIDKKTPVIQKRSARLISDTAR